ncbi:hypothetical protein [Sulfurimonas sp.]|uniref:hypothetical protein n=1 Tax=Sulfurimonas sp. TaxID=2022749 RepID=UPI00356893AB
MNKRELCICGKPIMIMDSRLETEIGTLDIQQVQKFGCLDKKCDKFQVAIKTTRQLANG